MNEPAWATTFNTVSVSVAKPAHEVWELFLDRAAWMPAFVSRRMLSGSPDTAGSLAAVENRTETGTIERFEETIVAEPGRRLVVRIWAPSMPLVVAHADFSFASVAEGCLVTATIHCWLAGEAAANASLLASSTQVKIDGDFQRLRSNAEGRTYAR